MTDQDFAVDTEAAEPVPELVFATLDEFVSKYIAQVVRRRLSRSVALWCPAWWLHEEAVARLSVLWRAFEHLKNDPGLGLSLWWTQHADPHLAMLMDPDRGPFVLCDPRDGHTEHPLEALPILPSPPELWRSPVFSATVPPDDDGEGPDSGEQGSGPRTPDFSGGAAGIPLPPGMKG